MHTAPKSKPVAAAPGRARRVAGLAAEGQARREAGPEAESQDLAAQLIEQLQDARRRELELFSDLTDEQLIGPELRIIEPPLWEVGHVAWFQERWILRNLDGAEPLLAQADRLYDSFNIPNARRWHLDFPSRQATLEYLAAVLDRCLLRLAGRQPTDHEAYFYRLALFHEDMHGETLTHIRQTLGYPPPALSIPPAGQLRTDPDFEPHDVEIPGGVYCLGASADLPFVFDNEKWAHPVSVPPYRISAAPVTTAEFLRFVKAGGYLDREAWSDDGWEWRLRAGAVHPVYWQRDGERWLRRHFDRLCPLEPRQPMIHVNWYEANAYCAWAGRRLPTEAEWELAASSEPTPDGRGITSRKRRYPWGDEPPAPEQANLDSRALGCAEVGAYPAGDSAFGCRQMLGNVWEWTADTFAAYPGFELDPYAEYSAPSFGQQKVLRGGCWATRSRLIRNTFRNFYTPDRNNIFAGFRTCAA
jgi:iron(II)-dependent oxidoreductase